MWDYLLAVAVGIIAYKFNQKGAPFYACGYLILAGISQMFVHAPMAEVRIFLLTAFGLWFFSRYKTRQSEHSVTGKHTDDDRSAGH